MPLMHERLHTHSTTKSVCPVCLGVIDAERVVYTDGIYLDKRCAEHGEFSALIWDGDERSYDAWARPDPPADALIKPLAAERGCPFDCGLCEEHIRSTCCALLEVTARCNLRCPVCFASAGESVSADPSLEELEAAYRSLAAHGGPFNIQLSGGEPTVRDDLDEIIMLGKKHGFNFFQLNTNGLRLADEPKYLARLVEAGLSCVFLQFDGLDDEIYRALRGAPLLEKKLRCIENCAAQNIGVVLVPTVVSGVNDASLGALLDFALARMPAVRGVHFQPASTFGRFEADSSASRLTIPKMLSLIEAQTSSRMKAADFIGGGAENSYCSFHANYMLEADGRLRALKTKSDDKSCCCSSSARSRDAVARRFSIRRAPIAKTLRPAAGAKAPDYSAASLDDFLERIENSTLAVSGMLFQDAYTFDLDRVRRCYVSEVARDGRMIPFCAFNLTDDKGNYLYRK